jgi:hypothetical protein
METVGDSGPFPFTSEVRTMPANRGVKIIKRKKRKDTYKVEPRPEGKEKTAPELTRAMKETIAEWVSEHRLKREEEINRNFEKLFAEAA